MKQGKVNGSGCEHIRPRLGQWLDGELPAKQRSEVELHLDGCGGCRKIIEEYRTVAGWVRHSRALEKVEPTADVFWNRLRRLLPERKTGWRALWQPWRQLWMQPRYRLVLATVMVLVALVVVFRGDSAPLEMAPIEGPVAAEPGHPVESVETGVPGGSLMVYHSESENLTVVWLFTENAGSSLTPTSSDERQTG